METYFKDIFLGHLQRVKLQKLISTVWDRIMGDMLHLERGFIGYGYAAETKN